MVGGVRVLGERERVRWSMGMVWEEVGEGGIKEGGG